MTARKIGGRRGEGGRVKIVKYCSTAACWVLGRGTAQLVCFS